MAIKMDGVIFSGNGTNAVNLTLTEGSEIKCDTCGVITVIERDEVSNLICKKCGSNNVTVFNSHRKSTQDKNSKIPDLNVGSVTKAVILTVSLYDIEEHAQKFMQRLGIKYGLSIPQSIADCWQFFMCEYNPETIPEFVRIRNDINPTSLIGNGLSPENAANIAKWMEENGFPIPSEK